MNMSPISSATPCILAGRGGLRLTKRLRNFGKRLEALVFSHWYTLALACALLAAAIFLVWLCMDAQSVAFIYSEF